MVHLFVMGLTNYKGIPKVMSIFLIYVSVSQSKPERSGHINHQEVIIASSKSMLNHIFISAAGR